MKPLLHTLLLPIWFAAIAAFAGSPQVEITVAPESGGAVVYKGQPDARGTFATPALQPGKYVIQFNAKNPAAMKGQEFALAAQAGRSRVTANAVPGEKFGGGGVAMKIEVKKAGKVTGNLTNTASIAALTGKEAVRANVKIMNGKRYVWVPGGIESQMGGKWVEEGTEGAILKDTNRKGGDNEFLRRIQDQSSNSGVQPDGFGLPPAQSGP